MQIDLLKVQCMLEWVKTKLYLDSLSEKCKKRLVKRGEVYECNFGIGIGSEMQKNRPCIIIQNDIRNINSGNVIVAPITHTSKSLPCMASFKTQYSLDGTVLLDGCINLSQIQTISKARLSNYITKLTNIDMKRVDIGIYDSLGLLKNIREFETKLNNKLEYIEKIKLERNSSQDMLYEIFELSNCKNFEELKSKLNEKK